MPLPRAHWIRTIFALIAGVVLCCSINLTSTPLARAAELTLDEGHVDAFHVSANGGALQLDLKEDVTGHNVIHAPEDVILSVKESALSNATESVPEIGQQTYFLPQTQDPNLLWPGWDTNGVRDGGFDSVDLHFTSISGPGSVYLFNQSLGSINPMANDGAFELRSGSVVTQAQPAHTHANWAFTAPGTYEMTVQASANGTTSNSATYTWVVGDGGSSAPVAHAASDSNVVVNDVPSDSSDTASQSNGAASNENAPAPKECLQLIPLIKDDRQSPAVWKRPDSETFNLGDAAKKSLPDALGPIPAGDAYMIGASQEPNVPWLGVNTMNPSLLEHASGDVTWSLTGFTGPGNMFVFTQGNLGNVIGDEWFRGENNQGEGQVVIPRNSHVHPNWVFSAPGTYQVEITQSAQLHDGSTTSGTATLTFEVGNEAGSATDGHFDFGSEIKTSSNCDGAQAAGHGGSGGSGTTNGSKSGAGAANGGRGSLPNTGTTVLTFPIAFLGLGILTLGGGLVFAARKFRWV